MGRPPIEFSARDVKSITSRYKKGEAMQALADDYGVSVGVIRRILSEGRVKVRRSGRRKA